MLYIMYCFMMCPCTTYLVALPWGRMGCALLWMIVFCKGRRCTDHLSDIPRTCHIPKCCSLTVAVNQSVTFSSNLWLFQLPIVIWHFTLEVWHTEETIVVPFLYRAAYNFLFLWRIIFAKKSFFQNNGKTTLHLVQ